ncbi:MAG: response regulator [Spartobacteria bacterium]|nr:response regulator [Spartobacteria bacterium]
MSKNKILIVEDEGDIQELVAYNLGRDGYQTRVVSTGEEAFTAAVNMKPDAILLDLMLPGVDGLEVCRRLKGSVETQHIPVLMMTAKGEESDIVVGLELGADDYITKPFSPKVLMARLKAVLRRKAREETRETSVLVRGELRIDPGRHEVCAGEGTIDLTATEFRVLHFLARKPGWVFTRQQIVDAVKGEDYPVTERSVDVQMVGLRKKLGDYADCVETVRGIGYRFRE